MISIIIERDRLRSVLVLVEDEESVIHRNCNNDHHVVYYIFPTCNRFETAFSIFSKSTSSRRVIWSSPVTINVVEKFHLVLRWGSLSEFVFKYCQIGFVGSFRMFERSNTTRFGISFGLIPNFSSKNVAISLSSKNSCPLNSAEGNKTTTTFSFLLNVFKNSYVRFVRPHFDATFIKTRTFPRNTLKWSVFPHTVLDLKSKTLISLKPRNSGNWETQASQASIH